MTTSTLVAAKQHLRNSMKQKLAGLPQEVINSQSCRICDTLKDFVPYQKAKRISIYLSMPAAEVQTDSIVRHALNSGKQVFVPYLHKYHVQAPDVPKRAMDMVRLSSIQDYENLQRDKWGIPSVDAATVHERQSILGASEHQPPATRTDFTPLDLMLVPGVAFNVEEGDGIKRLGHGKGFYDFFVNRYIAKAGQENLTANKTMLLYGLALNEQLLPPDSSVQIPVDAHDRPLDGLILGSGEIREAKT